MQVISREWGGCSPILSPGRNPICGGVIARFVCFQALLINFFKVCTLLLAEEESSGSFGGSLVGFKGDKTRRVL